MGLSRRSLGIAGLGAAAGAAGVGVAWWRHQPVPVLEEAEAQFWASRFEGIHGEGIDLNQWRGKPLLVNFWATWCPPCVEELPLLNAFYRTHVADGWQVLGLAVDRLEPVRRFLEKLPLEFPVALAGMAGIELSRALGNPTGGLPYSIVLNPSGKVTQRKIGKLTQADLAGWAQHL
jgi:thiol-disulfide isomerase/thioredoxin